MSGVPGFEGLVASRAGRAHEFSSLFEGERPAFPFVPVATHGAAMLALQGIFAALVERDRSGGGQAVETSLLRALGVYELSAWTPGAPRQVRVVDSPVLFYPAARTADGVWLQFSQNAPHLYRAFLRAIGLEHLLDDARFRTGPYVTDLDDARLLRGLVLARLCEKTWAQWQPIFAADTDLSVEPFIGPGEALDHQQMLHTGDAVVVDVPGLGPVRQLGPLATFSATPSRAPEARRRSARRSGGSIESIDRNARTASIRKGRASAGGDGAGAGDVDRHAHGRRVARRARGPGDQDRAARRRPHAPLRAQ